MSAGRRRRWSGYVLTLIAAIGVLGMAASSVVMAGLSLPW